MILGCIAFPIFFWKSLIIWVTPLFPILFCVYLCSGHKYRAWVYREKIVTNPFLYVSLFIALISTVTQFWGPIVDFITSWVVTSFLILCVLIFISVAVIKMRMRIIAMRKKSYEEDQKRLAKLEKLKADEQVIQKRKEEALEKLQALMSQEIISWKQLLPIYGIVPIPIEVMLKADFIGLYLVSDIKKQISFDPNMVKDVAKDLNQAVKNCWDDNVLKPFFEKMVEMEKYISYKGFEPFMNLLRTESISVIKFEERVQ